MVLKPKMGNGIAIDSLNSLDSYLLISMEEPWSLIEKYIDTQPKIHEFNSKMDYDHLINLADSLKSFILKDMKVVGLGGGTACDTAKFIAWWLRKEHNIDLDLIIIPSIISVDAFLCSSIAVRVDNKVKYVGESKTKEILIDFDLIRKAPAFLNRAGVSDTISITSALGDWKIARDENDEKYDQSVFNKSRKIAVDLMEMQAEICNVTEEGIKALVEGFYREVELCEEWGNARPEEGSEHFLAYCLESLTGNHYIHGNLIGMNILISLLLQGEYAEFSIDEMLQFFHDIQIQISPSHQRITYEQIKAALSNIKEYVLNEKLHYSLYNSPKLRLNLKKINEIIEFLRKI